MQISTPILTETSKALDGGETQIAVAIVNLSDGFNASSATLLRDAIVAGVKRRAVETVQCGDYHLPVVSVLLLTVPAASKAAALAGVRETLAELNLTACATIALYTDEQVLVTIQGFGEGGTKFAELFCRPELFEQAKANVREMEKTQPAKITVRLLELHKLLAKAAGITIP